MSGTRLLFAFAVLIAAYEIIYFYPIMPSPMAVHFNAAGAADGWGPKNYFFITIGGVIALLTIMFAGISLLIRILPDSLINLPNKDYWFAPERRTQTLQRLTGQLLFIGAITLLLLDGVLYLSCMANIPPASSMPAEILWGMLGSFFTVNIIWTVIMIRSYLRTG